MAAVRAVAAATENYRPTDAQIACHLARFIENVRALSIDPVVVRQNWLRPTTSPPSAAALTLNEYAREHDPFADIGRITVAVEITSVVRASDTSFQVRWLERTLRERRRQGRHALHRHPVDRHHARRARPNSCARTRSASTCTRSTGRKISAPETANDTSPAGSLPRPSPSLGACAPARAGARSHARQPRSAPRRC